MWEDTVYNLSRPVKTLRVEGAGDPCRRWLPRTPAMAAGLAKLDCQRTLNDNASS